MPGSLEEKMNFSLVSFLGAGSDSDRAGVGSATPADNDPKGLLNVLESRADSAMASSGMELFTSPQTLVNADINSDGAINIQDIISLINIILE